MSKGLNGQHFRSDNSRRCDVGHHRLVFRFSYQRSGRGWARATLSDGQAEVTVTAAYLSDALGSLCEAVAIVAEGESESRCSWDEEPGEFRFVFRRQTDTVALTVLSFPDNRSHLPDDRGELVFQAHVPVLRLARSVLAAAQAVLDEHGLDGYRAEWVTHEFPIEAVRRLRASIKAPQIEAQPIG